MRARLVIAEIAAALHIAKGNQPYRSGEPAALEIIRQAGSLLRVQRAVPNPGEITASDPPQLRPAAKPATYAGQLVIDRPLIRNSGGSGRPWAPRDPPAPRDSAPRG